MMNKFTMSALWKQMSLTVLALVILLLVFPTPTFASTSVLRQGSSGDLVRWLQVALKERGYFSYEPTGYFGPKTEQSLRLFQKHQGLTIDGTAGPVVFEHLRRPSGITPEDYWTVVNQAFLAGSYAVITDIETGLAFVVRRLGGILHADVEPLTAQDTAIFSKIVSGRWSWNRRAVLIDTGDRIYPASINCNPHSVDRVAGNNFAGHFCTHFFGSRIHGLNQPDRDHQQMVCKAAESIANGSYYNLARRSYTMLASRGFRPRRPAPPPSSDESTGEGE